MKKEMRFFICVSLLIFSFLIFTSSPDVLSSENLVGEKYGQNNLDSFYGLTYWNTTSVVSTASIEDSFYPSLGVDADGNVHVVWEDSTNFTNNGDDSDILYRRWNASISTWTTTEVVSLESTDDSFYPSMTIDADGNVHVTWYDFTDYDSCGTDKDLFYKMWDASNFMWTATEVVSTESTLSSHHSSLAVDSAGNVHIAWEDQTNHTNAGFDWDIFYKQWNATSTSWTTTEVVSTESTSSSYHPSLDLDSYGNVHLAWCDITNVTNCGLDFDIFYKQRNASTFAWTTTEVVSTESTLGSLNPSLAVDSNDNIHIAWEDDTDFDADFNPDIFYKSWNSITSSWNAVELISTESTADANEASLTVDSLGNVYVVWEDNTDYTGCGIDYDIFFKMWNFDSLAWNMTEVVSTSSTFDSSWSSIAADSAGHIHVAWYDDTDYLGSGTDHDIFYNSAIVDYPPMISDISHTPTTPSELDQINVEAAITDDFGIQNATLSYRVNAGSWQNITMTISGMFYNATIGPFAVGSMLDYFIKAYDSVSNSAESSIVNLEIIAFVGEFGSYISIFFITLTFVSIVALFRFYLLRKRR